jgi:hypothetical protein
VQDALNLIRNDRLLVDFDQNSATPKGYHHAVTSHFADVIERNTKLKLVKQQEGPPTLVDYKSKYDKTDWRHWRLASCALLTMPHEKGTGKGGLWVLTGVCAQVLVSGTEWRVDSKRSTKNLTRVRRGNKSTVTEEIHGPQARHSIARFVVCLVVPASSTKVHTSQPSPILVWMLLSRSVTLNLSL